MALNEDIRGGGNGEHDPGLTRIYRAAPSEEPPAHLDAAILAAARREARARPRALSAMHAWRVPVGIAAVVVLSVSLVTLVREEGGDALYQPVRPDIARPAEPAPQPSPDAKSPPADRRAAEPDAPRTGPGEAPQAQGGGREALSRRAEGGAERQAPEAAARTHPEPFQGAGESSGAGPAAPPALADDPARARDAASDRRSGPAAVMDRSPPAMSVPPSPERPAGAAAEVRRPAAPADSAPASKAVRNERDGSAREDGARQAAPDAVAPPPKAAAPAQKPALGSRPLGGLSPQRESAPPGHSPVTSTLRELDAQPPEKWLERIQMMRREGLIGEAGEVLAEFKRRYPAHPLPPELQ